MAAARRLILSLGVLVAVCASTYLTGAASQQPAGTIDPALFSELHWRHVGPFRAGRVNAVAGAIGQPNTFYSGSVGGGVWKTTNTGRTWTPIFDSTGVASIGAIAVAPSNPDIL